jgi:hypothetical protein
VVVSHVVLSSSPAAAALRSFFAAILTASSLFRNVILCYMVWLSATRTAKLLPHLWHRPQDIIHVPAFILFGYYFAIMKIYALFTLHVVRQPIASARSRDL